MQVGQQKLTSTVDRGDGNQDFKGYDGNRQEGPSSTLALSHDDDKPNEPPKLIVDLLVMQVECADVILINKTDLVTAETKQRVRRAVEALNSRALIVETEMSVVEPEVVLNTGNWRPCLNPRVLLRVRDDEASHLVLGYEGDTALRRGLVSLRSPSTLPSSSLCRAAGIKLQPRH